MTSVFNVLETSEKNRLLVLENQIAILRQRLNSLWEERGCFDESVLSVSLELDKVLNEYQRIMTF